MSTVRKSASDVLKNKGRIDREKIAALSDTQREQIRRDEGVDDASLGPAEVMVPLIDVRSLRERLGTSQEAFAQRYFIPLRTLQDWEQHRREPSEAVRVFLFAISTDPKGVERILRRGLNQQADTSLQ